MADGPRFRDIVRARLADLDWTRQRLAVEAGVSASYIYKLLWAGSGTRVHPSPAIVRRIAIALGLDPATLTAEPDLEQYLRQHLDRHTPLTETTAERVAYVVQLMSTETRWSDWAALCDALGVRPEVLQRVLDGEEPSAHVVRQLSMATGLGVRWWIRGRPEPDPLLVQHVCGLADATQYLRAIDEAAREGLSGRDVLALIRVHTQVRRQ